MASNPTTELTELEQSLLLLCSEPWKSIWVPGGRFKRIGTEARSAYAGECVVQTRSRLFGLGAFSYELESGETFSVCVTTVPEVGTTESERLFRPRREVVEAFPEDMPLDSFLSQRVCRATIFSSPNSVRTHADGVLFETEQKRFLVSVNPSLPESLLITMHCLLIETWCLNHTGNIKEIEVPKTPA